MEVIDMGKVRIVERVLPKGNREYVIQQRHSLFRWKWVDAWVNSGLGAMCVDSFPTLNEAKEHLCLFDGTGRRDTVVAELQ